ncbi:MAG: D-2-hydroxyacid dehydrogenase [Parachlamydiaceae bacterium]|nr:D-2-hydroxyacid dehydrogenase [Parachlamydiaceae bacterium]
MGTILIQVSLDPVAMARLRKEFPGYKLVYYQFLSLPKANSDPEEERWKDVEILFGNHLSVDQLKLATELRWIHNPTSSFSRFCLKDVLKQGNIILTKGSEDHLLPIGEFAMAGVLAFSKNLFHWHDLMKTPAATWDSKWRDHMWSLPEKVFLQIGLSKAGSEIARRAQGMGMVVWGVQERHSFHPYCEKTFTFEELHNVLPKVDVVSICLQNGEQRVDLLSHDELNLMKSDTILSVIGSHTTVNEAAIVTVGNTGKFRGIILDTLSRPSIASESPLWSVPNILITPEVSARPRALSKQLFQLFYFNLRQYAFGNYSDMRNRIDLIARE